jgi:hypothetical protein
MALLGRRSQTPRVSWSEVRPDRICTWEEGEKGVTLLVPRLGRGRIARKIERLFRGKPYRVNLDTVGSFVWRRLDGDATVAQIADAMHREFGERVEPVEDRLVTFLRTLERGRFVKISTGAKSAAASG